MKTPQFITSILNYFSNTTPEEKQQKTLANIYKSKFLFTDELIQMHAFLDERNCPDCKSKGCIHSGPWGGMAQNIICGVCGAGFNITLPFSTDRISAAIEIQQLFEAGDKTDKLAGKTKLTELWWVEAALEHETNTFSGRSWRS